MKLRNKKGFTLIELIVVIAIIGIVVLLAVPKLLGYVNKAQLARIKNDVKVAENFVTDKLLFNDNKLPDNWDVVGIKELTELTQEKKLYDIKGLVIDKDDIEEGEYFKLAEKPFNTKLKGDFYTNQGGKVYYKNLKSGVSGVITDENSNEGNIDDSEKDKVNKEDLINKKNEADKLNPDDYVDFTDVEKAINEADKVIKDDNATQKEVDDAKKKLEDAMNDLIVKNPINTVNKEDLINKKKEAEKLIPNDYVDFTEVEKAINEADKVIKNDNATQDEVDKAKKDLEDAMNDLIIKKPIDDDSELAKDEDFIYVESNQAPNIYENRKKGYYHYIGESDIVKIPTHINGNELKDYYKMFENTNVKQVISNNPKVINMRHMFYNSKTISLNLNKLDTSNVVDMSGMFLNSTIPKLDLLSFNTSKVTNMSYMFSNSETAELDISSFNTSNVVDMTGMFSNSKIPKLDLSLFDTSKVVDMNAFWVRGTNQYDPGYGEGSGMFEKAEAEIITLGTKFTCEKVESFSQMFRNSNATKITGLEYLNTFNSFQMYQMFYGSAATELNLSSFNTSNITDMGQMFALNKATNLNLSSFNTSNVKVMERMFSYSKANTIDLSSFDTSKVTNMDRMFMDGKAQKIYVKNRNELNKLNGLSYKPTGVIFEIKK